MTDQELIDAFKQSGNNQYLGAVLQRYSLLLFGVCMKYLKHEEDARDAVQQVFAKVITELPRYDIQFFSSWLYTIARNHCLILLRSKKYMTEEPVADLPDETIDTSAGPTAAMEKEKLVSLIEAGLEGLQNPQKECVSLFYLERKSYKEIADLTGHTLLQVKSAIQNGKRNIRIWVEQKLRNTNAS